MSNRNNLAATSLTLSALFILTFGPLHTASAQGTKTPIVTQGTPAPDDNGQIFTVSIPALNPSGQTAFSAFVTATSGGADDNSGIYRATTDPASFIQIARKGQPAPDANGIFGDLHNVTPYIDNTGLVAFSATLTGTADTINDDQGLFLGTGGPITQIAREGQTAPDTNGTFTSVLSAAPALNNTGQMAFGGALKDTSGGFADDAGIFRGQAGSITQIARKGQATPDTNGTFNFFSFNLSINDTGQVAFASTVAGTAGSSTDDTGIFRGSGGSITQMVREGQNAPDGNGLFSNLNLATITSRLNASGQIAFTSTLTNTHLGTNDNAGVFIADGGSITQVARKGQLSPDGISSFTDFKTPSLNDAGQAAFVAIADTSPPGEGIFIGSGGTLTEIARRGQLIPQGNGLHSFLTFGNPALNEAGQVAFLAKIQGTGITTSNDEGLYIADGIDIVKVAREDGFEFLSIGFHAGTDVGGKTGLNDAGQVAFYPTSSRREVSLWTPPHVQWNNASGDWDNPTQWAAQILPTSMFDVTIAPTAAAVIQGSATNEFVKSLTIGSGSGGQVQLDLNENTGDLTALNDSDILSDGRLHIQNNRIFNAPILNNAGVVTGDGQINAQLNNLEDGEVTASDGQHLRFVGDAPHTNNGLIEAIGSFGRATVQFDQHLTNSADTGQILGRDHAIFRFNDGLTNNGSIGLAFANATILGDIENTPTGVIAVGSTSTVIFNDDITNAGVINLASGANVVFFGDLSGNGVTGAGNVNIFGDLRPGFSPGIANFGGDVVFEPSASVQLELKAPTGPTPIPGNLGDHDQINITANVTLNGNLDLAILAHSDRPQLGTEYTAITYASRTHNSMFNSITGTLIDTNFALAPLFTDSDDPDDLDDHLILRATIPGDLNFDNKVSVADLSTFALNFNTNPGLYNETLALNSWQLGDFNADGQITVADLSLLALNFGFDAETETSASGLSAEEVASLAGITLGVVPEPGVLWVVFSAGGLLTWFGSRQSRL